MSNDRELLIHTSDGSVESVDGSVVFFSVERFVEQICNGDNCFICGATADSKPFNNEHVLPQWLLRQFNLYSTTIVLPNDTSVRYGSYTVPCCVDCNSLAGRELEEPMNRIFSAGHDSVVEYVAKNGVLRIFVWLALIILKTHLKDKQFRIERDIRVGDEKKIGDRYDWRELHHLHCIARSFLSRHEIVPEVFGSFFVLPAKQADHFLHFDFRDIYESQSILLRIGDVAVLSVLNDSCGALTMFYPQFQRINGALSPIQLREVLAHLSYLNLHLMDRPRYWTDFSDGPTIRAHVPEKFELDEFDNTHFGGIMDDCCGDMLEQFMNTDISQIREDMRNARHTFLWDTNGQFDPTSMDPILEQ